VPHREKFAEADGWSAARFGMLYQEEFTVDAPVFPTGVRDGPGSFGRPLSGLSDIF